MARNEDREKGSFEKMAEGVGGMMGRAADQAVNTAGSVVGAFGSTLGGWWLDQAEKALNSFSEEDDRRCREHHRAGGGGSPGGAGGGDRTAPAGGDSRSGGSGASGRFEASAGGSDDRAGGRMHAEGRMGETDVRGEVRGTAGPDGAQLDASVEAGGGDEERGGRRSGIGGTYEQARPFYQLGHAAGQNPEYRGRSFEEVEPELRQGWTGEQARQHGDWSDIRGFVGHGYRLGHSRGGNLP